MEMVLLLVVYIAYVYNAGSLVGYILLSVSSWFMAISWRFAPYRGGISVKGEESWEAW